MYMGVVFLLIELPHVSFDYNGGSIFMNPQHWWRKPTTLDSMFEFFLLILYCIAARSEPLVSQTGGNRLALPCV